MTFSTACSTNAYFLQPRYTGKERDSESGNDYFNARYLGSHAGRFLSPDPLGGHLEDPQTLNKYSYVGNNPLIRTDPTGLEFNLQCSGGNTATCQNGLQGSTSTDANGKSSFSATVISSDKNGNLTDKSGNKYSGSFDGKNVSFTGADGSKSNGSWIQGSNATSGITGGGALSSKFGFTFSDHGNGQSLHATFSYAGSFSDAEGELSKAGYSFSAFDGLFNLREALANPNAENYRSQGDPGTGRNSGHFLMNHSLLSLFPNHSVPTTGSVHTGETNPTASPSAAWQHWTNEQ